MARGEGHHQQETSEMAITISSRLTTDHPAGKMTHDTCVTRVATLLQHQLTNVTVVDHQLSVITPATSNEYDHVTQIRGYYPKKYNPERLIKLVRDWLNGELPDAAVSVTLDRDICVDGLL